MPQENIKTMKLYHQVERVFNELTALGFGPGDPIDVDTLSAFDQYHYLGTEAVDEAARCLRLQAAAKVLEVGSGIGGPSRHLAHRYGCHMTALELQADLHRTGEELTSRCGLLPRVQHRLGDILDGVSPGGFDGVVSWLTFLHIADRQTLYRRCFEALAPVGGLYVEDFYARGTLSEAELRMLSADVYCDHLPTLDQWDSGLRSAGFESIRIRDMTLPWTDFVAKRLGAYRTARKRNEKLHGEALVQDLEHFYTTMDRLFALGNLGGLRLWAWKPTE